MNVFGAILNYAEKVYNKVTGKNTTDNVSAAKNTQKSNDVSNNQTKRTETKNYPNSVTNPKGELVGTVGDTLKIRKPQAMKKTEQMPDIKEQMSQKSPQKPWQNNKELSSNIKGMQKSIEVACLKNPKIDYKLLMKGLGAIAGITEEQFKNLPENKQIALLKYIESSIRKAEKIAESQNINITEYIIVNAKITYDAVMRKGIFQNEKEMEELNNDSIIKDAKENFIDGIEDLSLEEIDLRVEEFHKELEKGFLEKMEEIKKLPEAQRKAEEVKLREQFRVMKEQIYADVLAKVDSDTALEAMSIVDSKDFGKASKHFIRTRANDAERTRCADKADFKFFQRKVKFYYNIDNDLQREAIEEYNSNIVSYKSADAVAMYQQDYITSRQDPNRPYYMSEDIYTATAIGIGIGAELNVNMTAEEKAEFIHTWNIDAQKFSDYETVKDSVDAAIQEYIKENPQSAKMIEELEKCKKELVKHIVKSAKFEKANDSYEKSETETSTGVMTESKTYVTSPISNQIQTEKTSVQKNEQENELKKTSEQKLLIKLNSGDVTINEAISAFGEKKAYKVVFSNSQLLTKYENEAIDYITRQKKVEDLVKLAKSGKAIELILKHNRVENKEVLYKELEDRASSVQKYMFKDKVNEAA